MQAPLVLKRVEEVFVRQGEILNLHVGGRVMATTPEHPFYVQDKGWIPAGELQIGDLLSTEAGDWIAVEDLLDTGEIATVYNLRVADYHTYFVGSTHWGFSVWVHNTYQQGWQRAFGRTSQDFGIPEGAAFRRWFDDVGIDELDRLYSILNARDILKDRLRHGGGDHEWLLVAKGNVFRRWGRTYDEIVGMSTPTNLTFFRDPVSGIIPPHGTNAISAQAHNHIAKLVDVANDYDDFVRRLRGWAQSGWLPNGVADLPVDLR